MNGEVEELKDKVRPEKALVRVRGVYDGFRKNDAYTLTVYGCGGTYDFYGTQEFREFVATVEWDAPAECGPAKDLAVFTKELGELRYRLAATPRPIGPRTSAVAVRAVFRTQ